MGRQEERGKLGNELSRWRKANKEGFSGRKQREGQVTGAERTRARVVCDGEVSGPDQAEPCSPR